MPSFEDKLKGLSQTERRIRVKELRCLGYNEIRMAEMLGVSEKTIRRDLESVGAQEIIDEILRRQSEDIEAEDDRRIRLHYRDKLLGKLIPRKVRQTMEGGKRPIIIEMWRPKDEEELLKGE